ncbi:MAG: tetratricopeptide repeat protein [Verrucomicrobiota bacterium]|nr:tetratricopeptide repeat protein [Verrucomicrobiota bacterium]
MTDAEKETISRRADDLDELEESTARERLVQTIALALLLIAATVFAYQQAWRAGLIWRDSIVLSTAGWKAIWQSLQAPAGYAPLVFSSFKVEHLLWGANPAGYHWVNFALHAINALLLWRILRVFDVPAAWLAAALFALHPVQVESVAFIATRGNLLVGLFFLLTVIAWQKFVAGKNRGELKFYFAALLCTLLALASNPVAACTLPLVLLLISWWKRGAISLARVIQVAPFAILTAVAAGLVWRARQHAGSGAFASVTLAERILIAARDFWFYLEKLVWPAHLAVDYPRWPLSATHPADYLWLGGCVLLIIGIVIARRWLGRGPETAFLFFALLLAPALAFIALETFRYSFASDRDQYLACIGPLALGAAAISTLLNPLPRVRTFLLPLICAALLLPVAYRTWRQGAIYANNETLWQATLAENPASPLAHNNLGLLRLNGGDVTSAIPHFEEAARVAPDYADAHFNLGNALILLGRTDEGRAEYERAVALDPQNAVARTNFGLLLAQEGRTAEATAQFEAAVKLDPNAGLPREQLGQLLVRQGRAEEGAEQLKTAAGATNTSDETRNELALALLEQGKPDEALTYAQQLIASNPEDTTAQTNYGVILGELGREDEAIAHFQKALQIDANNAEAHYNLANTLLRRRQLDEAAAEYRKALDVKPDYAAARLNLANSLVESGKLQDAVTEYQRVLETRPDYAAAHANLAAALNQLGRFDEALEHLQIAWKLEAKARSASPAPLK